MKSSARKVELASAADLFSTEQERQDAKLEKVQNIPLSELYPFPDHPFSVRDDDSMKETVESVKEYGVLMPAIARPREGGGYELVAGHRRKHACELAGLDTMPVIVRDLDRDTAIIFMADSNIQRENILPSERAKAWSKKKSTNFQIGIWQKWQSHGTIDVAYPGSFRLWKGAAHYVREKTGQQKPYFAFRREPEERRAICLQIR